jgi:hypothetical protein
LETTASDTRKRGLLRAFDIAVKVVSKLQELDRGSNLMMYAPATYRRIASLAAMIILKIYHSKYATFVDTEGGKRAFNIALALNRRSSVEDNDLPGRTSKILAQLWSAQVQGDHRAEEPSLKLRSRSGASLLHDSLWDWRERFGGQGSAP